MRNVPPSVVVLHKHSKDRGSTRVYNRHVWSGKFSFCMIIIINMFCTFIMRWQFIFVNFINSINVIDVPWWMKAFYIRMHYWIRHWSFNKGWNFKAPTEMQYRKPPVLWEEGSMSFAAASIEYSLRLITHLHLRERLFQWSKRKSAVITEPLPRTATLQTILSGFFVIQKGRIANVHSIKGVSNVTEILVQRTIRYGWPPHNEAGSNERNDHRP